MAGLKSLGRRLALLRAAGSSVALASLAGTLALPAPASAGISISINVGSSWSRGCGWYDTYPVWTAPIYHSNWSGGWAPAPCFSPAPPVVCFTPIYTPAYFPVYAAVPSRPLRWHDDDLWSDSSWCGTYWTPVYHSRPRWAWQPYRRYRHGWSDPFCAPVPAVVAIIQPAPILVTRHVAYSPAFSPWGTYTETTWYTPPAIYLPVASWCTPRPVCFVPPIYSPPTCSLYSGWSISININNHRPHHHRLSHEPVPVAVIPPPPAPLAPLAPAIPAIAATPPTVPTTALPPAPPIAAARPAPSIREGQAFDGPRLAERRPTVGERPEVAIAAAPTAPASPTAPIAPATPSLTDTRRSPSDRWPTPDRASTVASRTLADRNAVPTKPSAPAAQTPGTQSPGEWPATRTAQRPAEWPAEKRRTETPARPTAADAPSLTDRTNRTVPQRPAVPTIDPATKPVRQIEPMSGPRLSRRDAPALTPSESPALKPALKPTIEPAPSPRLTPAPSLTRPAPAQVPIRGLESRPSRPSRSPSIDVPASSRRPAATPELDPVRPTLPDTRRPSITPDRIPSRVPTDDTGNAKPRSIEQPSRSARPTTTPPSPGLNPSPMPTRPTLEPSRPLSPTRVQPPTQVPPATAPAPARSTNGDPTKRVAPPSRSRPDRIVDDRRVLRAIGRDRPLPPAAAPAAPAAPAPSRPAVEPSRAPAAAPNIAPAPAKSAPPAPATPAAPTKGAGSDE